MKEKKNSHEKTQKAQNYLRNLDKIGGIDGI